MQRTTYMPTSFGQALFRHKLVYLPALAALLLFSAFSSGPPNSVPFKDKGFKEKGLPPPDTLGLIDKDIKEQLLAEIRRNRYTDSLISFALELKGKPYRWGGKGPKGFDCSGFIFYIFEQFGYEMERSSRAQSRQGLEVALENVKKGDLLFFTGTNPEHKRVGHVGLVISEPGQEVAFVHSSSNGGIKVSDLKGYYESRILFARRLLPID